MRDIQLSLLEITQSYERRASKFFSDLQKKGKYPILSKLNTRLIIILAWPVINKRKKQPSSKLPSFQTSNSSPFETFQPLSTHLQFFNQLTTIITNSPLPLPIFPIVKFLPNHRTLEFPEPTLRLPRTERWSTRDPISIDMRNVKSQRRCFQSLPRRSRIYLTVYPPWITHSGGGGAGIGIWNRGEAIFERNFLHQHVNWQPPPG